MVRRLRRSRRRLVDCVLQRTLRAQRTDPVQLFRHRLAGREVRYLADAQHRRRRDLLLDLRNRQSAGRSYERDLHGWKQHPACDRSQNDLCGDLSERRNAHQRHPSFRRLSHASSAGSRAGDRGMPEQHLRRLAWGLCPECPLDRDLQSELRLWAYISSFGDTADYENNVWVGNIINSTGASGSVFCKGRGCPAVQSVWWAGYGVYQNVIVKNNYADLCGIGSTFKTARTRPDLRITVA